MRSAASCRTRTREHDLSGPFPPRLVGRGVGRRPRGRIDELCELGGRDPAAGDRVLERLPRSIDGQGFLGRRGAHGLGRPVVPVGVQQEDLSRRRCMASRLLVASTPRMSYKSARPTTPNASSLTRPRALRELATGRSKIQLVPAQVSGWSGGCSEATTIAGLPPVTTTVPESHGRGPAVRDVRVAARPVRRRRTIAAWRTSRGRSCPAAALRTRMWFRSSVRRSPR